VLLSGSGRNKFVPGQGEVKAKWCTTPRHTPGLPSGQQSVFLSFSGMLPIYSSGSFPFIRFCFPRSDLRSLVRGLWLVEISTGSGLATKSIKRLIMYVYFIRSALWPPPGSTSVAEVLTFRQVYGVKALQNGDGFPNAQGLCPSNLRPKKR
jgi:hypothetical protein